MKEKKLLIDRFEKWCRDCEWPNETLTFHLSMWTQIFPGRVRELLHELITERRGGDPFDQGETDEEDTKRGSYGFGDPSRITAKTPRQIARDSGRDKPSDE